MKADEDHLPGKLDCRLLLRSLTPEVADSNSEMGARENASSGFSFPPDDDEEFREGGKPLRQINRAACSRFIPHSL